MPRAMTHIKTEGIIPEIRGIGQIVFFDAYQPMPMEVHEDAFELLFIHSGKKNIKVQEEEYELSGGDLLLIPPGAKHGADTFLQTRATLFYLLIADPMDLECFCGMDDGERRILSDALRHPAEQRRMLSVEGQRFLRQMKNPIPGPMGGAKLRALLTLLLLEVVSPMVDPPFDLPEDIGRAIACIRNDPGEILSVGQLAAAARLSEPRFKQKFKQATGIPPGEYVVREKVDAAKPRLLKSGERITDIALSLGFSSSQHFSTLFKRYAGITPLEYRKNAREYDDTKRKE